LPIKEEGFSADLHFTQELNSGIRKYWGIRFETTFKSLLS